MPPRICVLGDTFAVPVRNLCRNLVALGWDVHVLHLGVQGEIPDVVCHQIGASRGLGLVAGLRRVPKVLDEVRPDIVHAFYLTSYGFLASFSTGMPVVVSAMGTDVFGAPELGRLMAPVRIAFARRALARADGIHSVAAHLTERLHELGARPEKIVTFPRGVALSRFRLDTRTSRPPGPYRLVCNRKLEPVYDYPTVLRAAEILVRAGVPFRLRIVGNGPLRESLEAQARALGVDACVTFEHPVSHDQVPSLLRESDVFVSASLSDGTSACLLEALASGCVPVVSDILANRPWVTNGTNGFLFEPGSAESLAVAIRGALDASGSWEEMKVRNRRRIVAEASEELALKKVLGLYAQLAKREELKRHILVTIEGL